MPEPSRPYLTRPPRVLFVSMTTQHQGESYPGHKRPHPNTCDPIQLSRRNGTVSKRTFIISSYISQLLCVDRRLRVLSNILKIRKAGVFWYHFGGRMNLQLKMAKAFCLRDWLTPSVVHLAWLNIVSTPRDLPLALYR